MNNKFVESKLKEFRQNFVPQPKGYVGVRFPSKYWDKTPMAALQQFIKEALSQMITPEQHQKTIDLALEKQREEILRTIASALEGASLTTDPLLLVRADIVELLQEISQGKLKTNKEEKQEECKHCGGSIAIRNPKGFCDHLYYPDNCTHCQKPEEFMEVKSIKPEELVVKTTSLRTPANVTDYQVNRELKKPEEHCKHKGGYLLNAVNGCTECALKTQEAFSEEDDWTINSR